jgi:PAS domain S-box-containing protein
MTETSEPIRLPEKLPAEPKANILLVDDQSANLLALRVILDDLGLNLVEAHSGEEALRRLLEDEFAVVLLDVQMPDLDGFETAKLIRGRAASRQTPIIFLTAFESDHFPVEQAYALGAVDYLIKPLVPIIVQAKVAGFVELFQKTQQVKHQAERIRQMERREFEVRLATENAALRESEQRFARFMQHLPGLAWVKDVQGRYVYANDAAVKVFRKPQAEIYGKTDDEIFPAATAAQFKENDRRALESGTGLSLVESLEHDDGVLHSSLVSKFPIPGTNGKAGFIGGIAIDITDRLRAEESLREADRRKDEFLATLAHELRNPLAPIRNSLQILKMPRVDATTAERVREMMERQVHHLVRLVDDLLDVSRVMRGKIELRKEAIELATVVARAVETAQPLIEAQGHELVVTLPPESLPVEADPVRLTQVVGNLLTNAAKYTEANGHIWLTVQREGGEVILRVRDDGIGIAPDMLPHIFELFVQADHASTRSQGGLGIGLTLVKNLVKMHHGTVEARSAGLRKGSEFVVRLPLSVHEPEGQEGQELAVYGQVKPSRHRLLVVDDNVDAADSLALLLRLQGHEVRVAHDGLTALEMANGYRPEVVFLDLGMPGMDGYEVARRMRQQPGLEKVVLAALTGWGQQEDRRRTSEAGFDHHLVKPPEPKALQVLLDALPKPDSPTKETS